LIIVSDAHVSATHGNSDAFFDMLDALAETDRDLLFLGDIFDLWISLPRYEEPMQRAFLAWCARQRDRREIGFVEGNHEFFVAERQAHHFSWASGDGRRMGALLAVHGDLINRADKNYLRFRRLAKNPLTKTLTRFMPFGPDLAVRLKRRLSYTNQAFRIGLPYEALNEYARHWFRQGVETILVGHFHEKYHFQGERGGHLYVLPDWYASGEISLFDRDAGGLKSLPWRQLVSGLVPAAAGAAG